MPSRKSSLRHYIIHSPLFATAHACLRERAGDQLPPLLIRHTFARELIKQIVPRHRGRDEAVERVQDRRPKLDQMAVLSDRSLRSGDEATRSG